MMKGKTKKLILSISLLATLTSCGDVDKSLSKNDIQSNNDSIQPLEVPRVEIISWSIVESTILLKSSKNISLDNFSLRKGETKSIYSLSGISLETGIVTTVNLPKSFVIYSHHLDSCLEVGASCSRQPMLSAFTSYPRVPHGSFSSNLSRKESNSFLF